MLDIPKQRFGYVAEDGSFSFHHTKDNHPRPQDFALHYEQGYEIYLFIRGEGQYNIEGNIYDLEPYSILIMNPNELHVLNISEYAPYERIVLVIQPSFLPPFMLLGVDFFRRFKYRKLGHGNQIRSDAVKENGLLELFDKLQALCEIKNSENEFVAKCVLVQLLHGLNNISDTDLQETPNTVNNKVDSVLVYINKNLTEPLTLDLLAEKFYLTKYHLCHIFKEATGYSINQYISFKRILMADGLMLKGYNPTQACFMSGFNNYSNFYKAYRKLTGKSPKSVKKNP